MKTLIKDVNFRDSKKKTYFPAFGPEKAPYLDTFHAVTAQSLGQLARWLSVRLRTKWL